MICDEQFASMSAFRCQFVTAWIDWLHTNPPEADVTSELMATQAAIRQAHDLITGRITIDETIGDVP